MRLGTECVQAIDEGCLVQCRAHFKLHVVQNGIGQPGRPEKTRPSSYVEASQSSFIEGRHLGQTEKALGAGDGDTSERSDPDVLKRCDGRVDYQIDTFAEEV